MLDDFVYFSTLIISIALGSYYKDIANVDVKQNYGTGIGMLIYFLICGRYLYHTILMVWLNAAILKFCDRRYVHIMSLSYTWLHLFYLHVSLSSYKYVIILHQNIALRLVGVAFEIYSTTKDESKTSSNESDIALMMQISLADLLSYAFCFIGLHKGPYYRYKVYMEHLKGTFGSMGDFRLITEHNLKKVAVCGVAYALLRMRYTTAMYSTKAFYSYDTESRYLYNVPFLAMFVLKNVIVMLLSTCVCTQAGFGVYPTRTLALPGHGPSVNLSLLNITPEKALELEYNFTMVKFYDREKLLKGPKMIDTVRGWNMTVRYWFFSHIYKNVADTSKEIRSAISFMIWSLWCGPSLATVIVSITLWAYILLEAEYSELCNTTGLMKSAWDIGFSIMRVLCLIYLTPCFVLNNTSTILKYYNSLLWIFHVVLVLLSLGAFATVKTRLRSPSLSVSLTC